MNSWRVVVLAVLVSLSFPLQLFAQWQPNGVPVVIAPANQYAPVMVSDGAGGAIVAWYDYRNGVTPDVYAQRIDAAGMPVWTSGGVVVCAAVNFQAASGIVSDGAGGAIVLWYDGRNGVNYDVYAQRINAAGVVQWTADGVVICNANNDQNNPLLVSDGAGGAIAAWYDFRGGNYDIYAQRINAAGVVQWTANGVVVCNASGHQYEQTLVSDGAGGAIIAWHDARGGALDTYAQRIDASGMSLWAANGIGLGTAANDQYNPETASDGAGGAIVVWQDSRSGFLDIYAQRVNSAGVVQWTANGQVICAAPNDQFDPVVASDGSGGAVITWGDYRSASATDVYAQRVGATGAVHWTANGVPVCTATNSQYLGSVISDGSGGAIVVWQDYRTGSYDAYIQHVNNAGLAQWTADGVAVCTAANDQGVPVIARDTNGGLVLAWHDFRTGIADIYAQRIETRFGYWGYPEPAITSVADVPGDQGGRVRVNWLAGDHDVLNLKTITHYSIWRATDPIAAAAAVAADPALLVDPSSIEDGFEGRAVRRERTPTVDYYWELVGTQVAQYLAGYRYSAATSADSTSQGSATHFFQVMSHTADPFVAWVSNTMSGHSVDNLAPAAPLSLMANRVGADVHLKWNRVRVPDLRDYAVYRATSSGVTPVPLNFLSSAGDTLLVDAGAPASALYYIVTAYDVHENQGPPSNEASVGALTGVGGAPPITALTVRQNYPNPFAGATEFEVGLPNASDVTIEIFDVAGRRVAALEERQVPAGWKQIPFAGRDERGRSLASGVYFYRVTAAGATTTRKMVIAR